MTTLIERMRQELIRRNYAAATIQSYLKAIEHFQKHVSSPLEAIGPGLSRIPARRKKARRQHRRAERVCSSLPVHQSAEARVERYTRGYRSGSRSAFTRGRKYMDHSFSAPTKRRTSTVITDIWRRKLKCLGNLCGPWKEELTPHRFRHTFARILLQKPGVTVRDVAELFPGP